MFENIFKNISVKPQMRIIKFEKNLLMRNVEPMYTLKMLKYYYIYVLNNVNLIYYIIYNEILKEIKNIFECDLILLKTFVGVHYII
jgi:hypothetical protein